MSKTYASNYLNRRYFRLLRESQADGDSSGGSSKWLGADGRLASLPNPLAREPARPPSFNADTAPIPHQPELETVI